MAEKNMITAPYGSHNDNIKSFINLNFPMYGCKNAPIKLAKKEKRKNNRVDSFANQIFVFVHLILKLVQMEATVISIRVRIIEECTERLESK